MNIDERRQEIIRYLMEHNTLSVSSIIEKMDESPATIRRDLTFLENNGMITRSRGYAKYVQPAVVSNLKVTEGKQIVAKLAAAMIPENATIFIDSGISGLALAQQIAAREDIVVFTNSLSVANELAKTNVSTYITCGHLEGRQECVVGPDTEEYIRGLRFQYLFLTTTGVRVREGLVCVTPVQASLKKMLIQTAEKVILLTDIKKFKTDAVRLFATFDDIDAIIVDEPLNDPEFERYLACAGVELIVGQGTDSRTGG